MSFDRSKIRLPRATAGGAPSPGEDRRSSRPPGWTRNLAWGAYGVAMLVVIGLLIYTFA